jgi:hypothetical protein
MDDNSTRPAPRVTESPGEFGPYGLSLDNHRLSAKRATVEGVANITGPHAQVSQRIVDSSVGTRVRMHDQPGPQMTDTPVIASCESSDCIMWSTHLTVPSSTKCNACILSDKAVLQACKMREHAYIAVYHCMARHFQAE